MPTVPRWLSLAFAATLLIVFGLGGFDRPFGLSGGQGLALGIVLGALVLWVTEAVPLFVTGMAVGLVGAVSLAPRLGVPSQTFIQPFASDVILLFLGGFVLSAMMERHGLARRLAAQVLARAGTSPPRVVLGLLLTTAVLSMWMSNTAATAMMLALLGALLPRIPEGDPLRAALVLAIAAGANLGGLGTPIGTPPNAVALASLSAEIAPTFTGWLLRAAPVLLVSLYGAWRLLLAWFPTTVTEVVIPIDPEPLDNEARWTGAIVLCTAGLWLTVGLHPLSLGTVGMLPVILAFGSGLLPQSGLRTLPWDVLMLVGGGLCLGAVVSTSALDDWMLALLPLAGLGAVLTLTLLVVVAASLSTVMSNTAAANLIVPIALGIPGLPPVLTAMAVAFACSAAMVLPVSTPPNAMAFGTGEVSMAVFTRAGLALTGIGIGSVLVVGLPWWALLNWLL